MTAPRTEEASPQDESESPLALWQALVAAAALSGLLAMKYVKRAPAAAKAAEPAPAKTAAAASETTPSGRFAMLLAVVRTRIEPLRAKIAALRPSKAAERPAQPPAPKDAPAKPKTLDWTDVATVLRARFGGAKAAGERSAAASNHVIALVESEGRGRMSELLGDERRGRPRAAGAGRRQRADDRHERPAAAALGAELTIEIELDRK